MDFVLVGPGRAGLSLSQRMVDAGHRAVAVMARDAAAGASAGERLGSPPLEWGTTLPSADLLVVAVRDDAIGEVAEQLGPAAGGVVAAVHLSGLKPVAELDPLGTASLGSFHPLQTMPTPELGAARLEGAWVAVTTDDDYLADRLFSLAASIGMHPFELADEAKALYHAAAAAAANYPLAALAMAERLFAAAGVPFDATKPLVRAVIANAAEVGPGPALTGPIARGDIETVRAQLRAVAEAAPELSDHFAAFARATADAAGTSDVMDEVFAVKIVETFAEARDLTVGTRSALVPTMGSLHQGHLQHVPAARDVAETVVMSLFVNPLQFDDTSDLDAYPRDLDGDAVLAREAGVDVLFAPAPEEVYPHDPLTRIHVGGVTDQMEGEHRPGHFAGVAIVVTKLLAGLQPDHATFGRKDAQQLAVVRRLARDLSFPAQIVEVSTVREPDGLAMSSRNSRLGRDDRIAATRLSRGLFAAAEAVAGGERVGAVLESIVTEHLAEGGIAPQYVTLADAEMATAIPQLDRPAFLATAARVGGVRLIDNVFLWPDGTADTGTHVESPADAGRT